MSTVSADLIIEVNVDCPKCDHCFDLTDSDINEEGFIYDQVLSDERWKVDASERLECSVNCPECDNEFKVKGINW